MKALTEAERNVVYQIKELTMEEDAKRHLNDLGIIPGGKIVLVNVSGENGIILLHNSRIAVNQGLLANIIVEQPSSNQESWLSLDLLEAGDRGTVVGIHGKGAIRRRLMDMGLTRGVAVAVRKLAPLGDPIEITIRGYELTLRKEEAALVLIQKEEQ